MRLYVAGNGKSPGSPQRDYGIGLRNRLISYGFLKDWAREEFQFWVDGLPAGASVWLDSGAFSAHTLGRDIDLSEYCDYVAEHRGALAAYATLDVIGDADGTWRNLERMRAQGLDPVPIYHVASEPLHVLDAVLDSPGAARYIALGGMASERATRETLQKALDECWRHIRSRWPERPVRVHGLGVMSQWALERYPWYSCDGSSAITGAGMGRVMRFSRGVMSADGWREDARATYDGLGVDGVGRTVDPLLLEKSASAHEGRRQLNIEAQLRLERYVTRLWAMKGVTW